MPRGKRAAGAKSSDGPAATGNGRGSPRTTPVESSTTGNGRGSPRTTPVESSTTRNGRGRPRTTPVESSTTRNGRGRPRTTPVESSTTGNGRGRPMTAPAESSTTGNGRGRPRTTPVESDTTGNGRGKPRTAPAESSTTGNGRGRPRTTPVESDTTGNGRGRPRTTPAESSTTENGKGRPRTTPVEPTETGNNSDRPRTMGKKTPDVPAESRRKSATPRNSGPPRANKPNKQTIRRARTAEVDFKIKLKNAIDDLVRVPSEHKSETAKIYNPIVKCILEEIKKTAVNEGESDIFRIRQLNSGSYFENLKVGTTNEFDFMFCIYGQKLVVEETEPSLGMVAVKLPPRNRSSLRKYLTPDGFLSPKKLLNRFRGLVDQAISTLSGAGADSPFKGLQFELTRQKDGCPAVTLMVAKRRLQISIDLVLALELPAPWPKCTHGWNNDVTLWPDSRGTRAIKKNTLHLVAKAAPHDKDPGGNKLWRLSFSETEKDIFNGRGQILSPTDAGNHATTCRKDCLRCLKYIKYKLQLTGVVAKHDVDFASYHLKTVLLHAIVKRPGGWENENLVTCLVYVIDELMSSIEKRHLPHFFIPGYNLFDPAVFGGLEQLGTVKDQFLRVKEDLTEGRLPEELDPLVMSVH